MADVNAAKVIIKIWILLAMRWMLSIEHCLFTTNKFIFAVGEVRRKDLASGNVWCGV
jgi:hypothetical protein